MQLCAEKVPQPPEGLAGAGRTVRFPSLLLWVAEFHTGYVAAKGDVTEAAPHPVHGWNLSLLFWNSLGHISGMVGCNCWCWLFLTVRLC